MPSASGYTNNRPSPPRGPDDVDGRPGFLLAGGRHTSAEGSLVATHWTLAGSRPDGLVSRPGIGGHTAASALVGVGPFLVDGDRDMARTTRPVALPTTIHTTV